MAIALRFNENILIRSSSTVKSTVCTIWKLAEWMSWRRFESFARLIYMIRVQFREISKNSRWRGRSDPFLAKRFVRQGLPTTQPLLVEAIYCVALVSVLCETSICQRLTPITYRFKTRCLYRRDFQPHISSVDWQEITWPFSLLWLRN